MGPGGRRAVIIGGAVAVVGIVTAAVLTLTNGGSSPPGAQAGTTTPEVTAATPTSAAQQYLQSFAAGDTQAAGTLTDDAQSATAALAAAWSALSPTQVEAVLGTVTPSGNAAATVAYTASWTLQGHVWSYPGTFSVVRKGANWTVHWTPAVLYPTLQAGQRLTLVTSAPDQPVVLDTDGKPLVVAGSDGVHLVDADFGLIQSALTHPLAPQAKVFAVERVDSAGTDLETLFGSTGTQPKPLTSTLSSTIESAATAAVNGYSGPAVIVALQPSTGGLLAVAQNAASVQAGSSPFSGLYPPGSTFKIVTATAALEAGLANPDSALPCPSSALIGQRTIRNDGEFDLGTVPMHEAFAKSCNTTFAQLAFQLPADDLASTAGQFGLDADYDIPGLNTQTGVVTPAASPDELVEDGIGQGRVLVSPFGEALMAATVESGQQVTPQLWTNVPTGVNTGYSPPPSGVLASLRSMMREVVTSGTATGLAGSGQVYGKTGTAQFGGGDNDAHGWFVGYRDDMAFVVFLQGAGDSRPAVTVAAQFLAALH